MDESPKSPAPPVPLSRWIARIMVAVILAEGIWGLLVSLTRDLIVPFLARQMSADPQSPLYLGKGAYDFPALFVSLLELCLAGIVAAVLYAWSKGQPKPARTRTVIVRKAAPAAPARALSIAPLPETTAATTQAPPAPAQTAEPSAPAQARPAPQPAIPPVPTPQPQPVQVGQSQPAAAKAPPAKPSKPKPPKEVYYNIVGEPINPTEDDE
jgi:hypothetical protein